MSIKRTCLKLVFLLMMAAASFSFAGPMDPKQIEDMMRIMNETRVELVIPDRTNKGDGLPPTAT